MVFLEAALCIILPDDQAASHRWTTEIAKPLGTARLATGGRTSRNTPSGIYSLRQAQGRLREIQMGRWDTYEGRSSWWHLLWELSGSLGFTTFRVRDERSLRYRPIDSPGGT